MEYRASVVIVTRNRREDLRKAIQSVERQDTPCEILVADDGSEDGTPDMVEKEFPHVRLYKSKTNLGCIGQRNLMAREAAGEIIFSLDDDAEFGDPHTVSRVLDDFDRPWIGAVAIPHINVNVSPWIHYGVPGPGFYVASEFIGCAHALRKSLFLQLGGFRESFFYSQEETDYCLKMLKAGYHVRVGNAVPILHYVSPKRPVKKNVRYMARNIILVIWYNAPWSYVLPQILSGSLKNLWRDAKKGHLLSSLAGMLDAFRAMLWGPEPRRALDGRTYRIFRLLKKRGPLEVSAVPESYRMFMK